LKQAFGIEEAMEVQDATKVRLLQAAGQEFADKGFECARIRAICERAQANVAAVNYHFGDKEQLYVAAVLEAHRCGSAPEGGDESGTREPVEELREFIHHFLSRVLALHDPDDWRHRLMIREMLHPSPASDVLIREAIRPRFEGLMRILRRFCPEAEERKIHALAFSVIGQCLHYKMARSIAERLIGSDGMAALDLDYLTEHITSFCLAALGCVPPLDATGEPAADGVAARS
jgi:TetR/AcrR family transcriptional regulator, regulator of cefoperazone and chloramphenicol sensitivity